MLTSIRGLAAALVLTTSPFAATAALADETDPPKEFTVTGNVTGVSDYRFRGLSQSAGDPAIQAGLNLNHSSGFYVGAWASTINFANISPLTSSIYGKSELDLFAGWTGAIANGVTADAGLLFYVYPGGKVGKANFFEPYASVSGTVGPVTAKLGLAYAWKQASLDFNADGKSDDNVYIYTDLSAGIPDTPVSVSAHLGYTDGALSPNFATGRSANYKGGFDYSLGATYTVTKNISVGVSYVGVDGNSLKDYSNDTAVFTLKLSF